MEVLALERTDKAALKNGEKKRYGPVADASRGLDEGEGPETIREE